MKIVWIQRYPSDNPTPIAMSDAAAAEYVRQKQDDYRYNSGRVWVEEAQRQLTQKENEL